MLDGVGLDLAVDAMRRFGADVVGPIHAPVHPRAAARAPKAASARRGGLDMPTVTAGLRRIRLVHPFDYPAHPRRLLAEGAGELPMWPLADLLIRLPAQTHPRLDVAHIPHRAAAHSLSLAEVQYRAHRLMQD